MLKKNWKRNNRFSEVIKRIFNNYLQEKKQKEAQPLEAKIYCIDKTLQRISENPMAEKYKHIQRTHQNIHQIVHREDLMSTEAKQKWALLANFSPCRYGDEETKHNGTEDVQIFSIRGQFTFGTKLQTFQ